MTDITGRELEVKTYTEELFLTCDRGEIHEWLKSQYPAHITYYKRFPRGFMFHINLCKIEAECLPQHPNFKYIIRVTEFEKSKIGQDFISSLRDCYQVVSKESGIEMRKYLPKDPPGRPPFKEDEWAWEQVNVLGRKSAEVRNEWMKMGRVEKELADPARQFRKIIQPFWNEKRRTKRA